MDNDRRNNLTTANFDLCCSEPSGLTCIPRESTDSKFVAVSFICHTEKLILGPQLLAIKHLHVDPQFVFTDLRDCMDPLVSCESKDEM